ARLRAAHDTHADLPPEGRSSPDPEGRGPAVPRPSAAAVGQARRRARSRRSGPRVLAVALLGIVVAGAATAGAAMAFWADPGAIGACAQASLQRKVRARRSLP